MRDLRLSSPSSHSVELMQTFRSMFVLVHGSSGGAGEGVGVSNLVGVGVLGPGVGSNVGMLVGNVVGGDDGGTEGGEEGNVDGF